MTQTMEPRVRDNGAPEATTIQPARPGKAARIVGWIISAIIILWLGVAGTIFALTNRAMVEQTMTDFGYPVSSIMKIQIVLVCCVILYAIPQTAVLGAILLTGYLGGAVAMHVRAADGQWFFPIIFGVLVWLGLVLRDPRLRSLVPLRKV